MDTSIKGLPMNFNFHVPYHPAVSEKDMFQAAELLADREQSAARQHQNRMKIFAADLQQRRDKLRTLLGGENYFALYQFKQALRLEAIKKRQPPYGLGMRRADFTRLQNQRIAAFLSERGIQSEVVHRTAQQLFGGLSFSSDIADVGPIKLGPIMLPPSPNPWVTFTPPFTGGGSGGYGEGAVGFSFYRETLYDAAAGHVGQIITLEDYDAGDDDYGFAYQNNDVGFWFQAPIAGLVEVIIDAQCGEARHELWVEDEWGFSDSSTTQRNLLMMEVAHPNVRHPVFSLTSEFKHEGADDASFDEQHLIPGQDVHTESLISDGPIPAGAWVVIRAGCRSEGDAFANDVKVNSKSTFSWFIKRVHVRILE